MRVHPLSAIYGGLVTGRNFLYDRGVFSEHRLEGAVISVGNLSTGGAGKTPFVIMLGELLKARGMSFDVLSRGYGRKTRGVLPVDPTGAARDFGDEPLLIARRLQVPVVVGEDRFEAGKFAERKFGRGLHLLDDGFQHRALARDCEMVLVTPEDARDRMLPAGRLREPLRALRRADIVVLTSGALAEWFPVEGKTVWKLRRGITTGKVPPRPIVFCGIARPKNFLMQLQKAGIDPVAEAIFRDHYGYSEADVRDLLELRKRSEGGGFITTEKDAVNLGKYVDALAPLAIVAVKMDLVDAEGSVGAMLELIEERRRRHAS